MPKFTFETACRIADRYADLCSCNGAQPVNRLALIMYLECSTDCCGLDLDGLLAADEFNFAHDVAGIIRHLDRETKTMRDYFRPRFARK